MGVNASKHTGKSKKPVCGDFRHDLNYSEIPDSWGELFEIFEQVKSSCPKFPDNSSTRRCKR